ncbi:MAG: tRNA pseudouridine(38-40) synthase TruA [Candidatus Marinimicrobia bacterium]|nr:tRNA pseudouridine(38-40) synthase TruA [Candidatus Neomarinimicrobiota bacterium]
MKRYILHVEYDGTRYAGYQLQPDVITIQGELETALEAIYHAPVRIHASGRTDTGVHAHYQIIHFDPPCELKNLNLKAALNTLLTGDIRVINTAIQDETFHARYSARERRYRYIVSTRETALDRFRVWRFFHSLDFLAMQECASILLGEHDFTSFCSAQAEVNHKRCTILRSAWEQDETRLIYYINGNRFLHSMVRSLVGTMVEVGKGRITPDEFASMLELRDRSAGAVTAPPQGLSLIYVRYEHPIPWTKEIL